MRYRLRTVTFQACEPASDRVVDGPRSAASVLAQLDIDHDRENFVVLALNARGKVAGFKVVAVGTLTACLVHPREVFRAALALSAHSIILAHNHPSGDVDPSAEDAALTSRLVEAGQILGVPVVDSLVFNARGEFRSLGGQS